MKVILSVESIRFPLTGIGRYVWELAQELERNSSIEELLFFSGKRFIPRLLVAEEKTGRGYAIKRLAQKNYLISETYRLLSPLLKAHALKGYQDYLYHSPNFFLPPFPGKRVSTFHDLSPFTWAQCNTPQRIRYMQKESLKAIEHADALITDSEYTRNELADYFSLPRERIHVASLASSAVFYPRSLDEVLPILKQYGLTLEGYTLFVGTIEPRKNIIALLDAYEMLSEQQRSRWPLILVGYKGWLSEPIHERIRLAEQQGWAHYLGFVPLAYLPILYAGARLFVFPSLYEGFGLPVLEAMASGVPVVCSNSSSLPEVTGSAALMSSPEDVDALANNLRQGLEDNIWRAFAINAGLEQASYFSWVKCATDTINAYQKVLES